MHDKGAYERYIKRPQDFLCALAAIVLLSPAILVTAALVCKRLGRPVLFVQERAGRGGKAFRLYKFRTMTDEHDRCGNLLPDAERLTPFGAWLRASSLDELPELINILKGDMAVVGPRPLLVRYLNRYNPEQARRHEVRPGLTGLAQIHGRNNTSWEERLAWDVSYVNNVTFLGDWRIILSTFRTVLSREGTSPTSSVTMEEFMGTEPRS